jgi:hypothetical protein
MGRIVQVALQVRFDPGLFLKERIARVALQVRLEPSKVSRAIFHILVHKPKIQT